MATERAQDCPTRIAVGLGSGFLAGSLMGGISANWSDVPTVLRDKPLPALMRTGSVMGRFGATLALIGGTFATVDCVAESIRGKKDYINGVLGGLAAGGVLGLRIGKLSTAVQSAALLAVASAAVDASGGKLTGQIIEDGATPPRRVYPY